MSGRLLPILVLAAAACAPAPGSPAQRGYTRARRDIADGHVCLRTIGFPCSSNSGLDPESGLLRESDGCIGPADDPERAAYNAEMRRAAAAGEVDRFVFLDRVRTEEQIVGVLASGTPVKEGEPALLLGGRLRAELDPETHPNGASGWLLHVYELDDAKPPIELNAHRAAVTVAVDPDGRTLVVDFGYCRRTADLATGMPLQWFEATRDAR
jgi:hypothetical protein